MGWVDFLISDCGLRLPAGRQGTRSLRTAKGPDLSTSRSCFLINFVKKSETINCGNGAMRGRILAAAGE
ncbi:MAG: hypothetical protein ACXU9L_08070, partial [Thermodesulfobacteriota bacterium]